MRVSLIAQTMKSEETFPGGWIDDGDWWENRDEDADQLAEFAGRACYQSWNRPNPATATNQGYLQNILFQDHGSVLEHASATFYIEGVSRSLTHELVRHRHLSFSELSQRFVNVELAEFVVPPLIEEWRHMWCVGEDIVSAAAAQGAYTEIVGDLLAENIPRKQAREAARAVLPNNIETKIVVTGNHRAWREVLEKRGSLHADAEIRLLACELYLNLKTIAPATYQDFSMEKSEDDRVWLKRTPVVRPGSEEPSAPKPMNIESMKDAIRQGAFSCGMTPQDFEEG